jgi:hypothetical protein
LKGGRGGDQRIAQLLGLDVGTVTRGRHELLEQDIESERVRRADDGRKRLKNKMPEVIARIAELRERCAVDNLPVISVDTKKKELVGTFRNPGAEWDREPESPCSSMTTISAPTPTESPFPMASTTSLPTPAPCSLAPPTIPPASRSDCVEKWWRTERRRRYPNANRLTILADGGGSDSSAADCKGRNPAQVELHNRTLLNKGIYICAGLRATNTTRLSRSDLRCITEDTPQYQGIRVALTTRTVIGALHSTILCMGYVDQLSLIRQDFF